MDGSHIVLLVLIIVILVIVYTITLREGAAFTKGSQHVGFGGYPPSLYGEEPSNKYYSEDLKNVLRHSNHYSSMAGLKMPVYDVNDYLEEGDHRSTVVDNRI